MESTQSRPKSTAITSNAHIMKENLTTSRGISPNTVGAFGDSVPKSWRNGNHWVRSGNLDPPIRVTRSANLRQGLVMTTSVHRGGK